jgi:hypothetical protein
LEAREGLPNTAEEFKRYSFPNSRTMIVSGWNPR